MTLEKTQVSATNTISLLVVQDKELPVTQHGGGLS